MVVSVVTDISEVIASVELNVESVGIFSVVVLEVLASAVTSVVASVVADVLEVDVLVVTDTSEIIASVEVNVDSVGVSSVVVPEVVDSAASSSVASGGADVLEVVVSVVTDISEVVASVVVVVVAAVLVATYTTSIGLKWRDDGL